MRKILLEDRRSQLLSKSKSGRNYVPYNQAKGRNRFYRRLKSRINSSRRNFNNIDMNKIFKEDILDVTLDIIGETNAYNVRVSFSGMLDELHGLLRSKGDDYTLDRRDLARSLTRAFNNNDVYTRCNCADFHFRFSYHKSQDGTIIGEKESRPNRFSWTNKENDMGSGCKHINLVLNDSSWLLTVASVIYNYINHMKDMNSRLYERYIYPAIYEEPYPQEQLSLFDDEEEQMPTSTQDIDASNKAARERGQFKKGNEYRFQKYKPDPNQFTLDDYGADEEETDTENL